MNAFRVLKPGLFTTVQDVGRHGYLKHGVPISGAMDTYSLVTANLLVGNDLNAACLETTLIGPELQALRETQVAVTGGDTAPRINDQKVPMWQTLNVQNGDVISFGRMESGCRAYISVRGGIDTPLVLGSRSTYVRGGFGGLSGKQLKTGNVIERFNVPLLRFRYLMPEKLVPEFLSKFTARVILGPQSDMFTDEGVSTFFSSKYKVTAQSDRMGYRLEGSLIEHKAKADIVSDALLPGAIQVPKSGKPIVIMRDAQTTGGYAKIAAVMTLDISVLGQARPDSIIEFSTIAVHEAHEKMRERNRVLSNLRSMLERKT